DLDHVIDSMGEQGLLSPTAAQRARALVSEGQSFEQALLAADGLSEEALLRFLSGMLGLPYVDLETGAPDKAFVARFPVRLLVRHNVLPIEERDGLVVVATARPSDSGPLDQLRLATG